MADSGETEETIRVLQQVERHMWAHPMQLDKLMKQGLVTAENGHLRLTEAGRSFIENWGTTGDNSSL